LTLLIIGIPILVLLAGLALWCTWLSGELVLATGDTADYPPISLWGPRRSQRVDELLGKPARLIVCGSLRHRALKVRMKIEGHLWSGVPVWLPRGGTRNNIAGVAVQHRRRTSGRRFLRRRR
jgi:hypothetical protein